MQAVAKTSVKSPIHEFLDLGRKILIHIDRNDRPIPKTIWKQWRELLDSLPLPTDVYDPIVYRIRRMKENDRLVSRFDVLLIQKSVRRYFLDNLLSSDDSQLQVEN